MLIFYRKCFFTMKKILLLSCLFLLSCEKYNISVTRQTVDVNYLASSQVATPDPRKENPPIGQKLIVDWHIPWDMLHEGPKGRLHVICKDYSEDVVEFPIDALNGFIVYDLLNDRYEKTGGFLTYKAELIGRDGKVLKKWKHQLWVHIIHLDQEPKATSSLESDEWIKSTSSSVSDQSMQGSVIETPYSGEEENF